MAAYVPNPLDTAAQRRFAFSDGNSGPQIRTGLITRNINLPYFNEGGTTLACVRTMYAMGRCAEKGISVADFSRPIAALETIAPNLADDDFADTNTSRNIFIKAGIRFIIDHGFANAYAKRNLVTWQGFTEVEASHVRILSRAILPWDREAAVIATEMIGGGDEIADVAEAIARLLHWLFLSNTAKGKSCGTNLYILGYFGLSTRWKNIQSRNLDRFLRYINKENNLECDLRVQEIVNFAACMAGVVNKDNLQSIMTAVGEQMAKLSRRMMIFMSQEAKTGMTCYWAIREAVTRYQDFSWDSAYPYIAQDLTAFKAAFKAVGDNVYYGFVDSLGVAGKTRYKSLSWLAIKLLLKNNGAEFGWLQLTREEPERSHRAYLQQLIDAYKPSLDTLKAAQEQHHPIF